jgi:arylsulfatase A-like enzyme
VIEGGRKIEQPMINLDLLPTLARLAGANIPTGLDGIDVSALLTARAAALPYRDLYFFTGQEGLDHEQIAIRSADGWKLVVIGPDIRRPDGYRTPKHRADLFRISDDPYERHDVAAEHPDLVRKLGEKLVDFRNSELSGAMPPINKPPAGLKPPRQWRNTPITGPAVEEK